MTANTPQQRYARQRQFAPIGELGQQQIQRSDVAVLGCGALGTVAAEILCRAGVGRLRLIDRDIVEWTNLQRQSLFDESDAEHARAKAAAAATRLRMINSEIQIDPVVADVTADTIRNTLAGCDLVIDAADNFSVRFLLNDWSLATQTAWVHGGCVGANGQVRLFTGGGSPCFRCLVPQPPPAGTIATCDTAGVIGGATHLIASLQATEAIKWLSGNGASVRQNVFSIDLWTNRVRELTIDAGLSKHCLACGQRDYEFLQGERSSSSEPAVSLCGRDAVQISAASESRIDFAVMTERWQSAGRVEATPFFVRLSPTEQHTITLFRDGRAVIAGTSDLSEARSLYDRFVG